jgi:DNA-binding NtrC family response regulator
MAACASRPNRREKIMARLCRILVIEDNELVLGAVNEAISIEGYQVELVRPPVAPVADIDFADFDVAIIDLALPRGCDGLALAQQAADCAIGVILLSGDHAQFVRAAHAGHAVLAKPFRLADLARLIEAALAETGSDRESSRDAVTA